MPRALVTVCFDSSIASMFGRRVLLKWSVICIATMFLHCDTEKYQNNRIQVSNETQVGPWPFGGIHPGSLGLPTNVVQSILAGWGKREEGYQPRTRHKDVTGKPLYTNRLFLEPSPYLLQHAHNPVNWFPWGKEAFATAKKEGKLILLSVGYSTCHWCHVMEEESFEDDLVAHSMNKNYVAVKVDRETRPDVDSVYMAAVHRLRKRGGWPMTVWLTPSGDPIYAGTYFPKKKFRKLLDQFSSEFSSQPAVLQQKAKVIALQVEQDLSPNTGDISDMSVMVAPMVTAGAKRFLRSFDTLVGGIRSRRTKFPSSLPIRFLLRYGRRYHDTPSKEAALLTLRKMAEGGLYDQLGGGFHRYSTDPAWLVPHFEKMLYDNGLLLSAYSEGYQVAPSPLFAKVLRETVGWVLRDMVAPQGGFYSATDADSMNPSGHKEEGWYFTWTPEEVSTVVSPLEAKVLFAHYGVTKRGQLDGRNVFHVEKKIAQVAAELRLPKKQVREVLVAAQQKLLSHRRTRPKPERDDKILSGWNGLMISGLVKAGAVWPSVARTQQDSVTSVHFRGDIATNAVSGNRGVDPVAVARRAAEFVFTSLWHKDGYLHRGYHHGPIGRGFVDDYAFVMQACLDLFEATQELIWFERAKHLDAVIVSEFEQAKTGFVFATGRHHDTLFAKDRPLRDGAIPTGTSVHMLNLLRMYNGTYDPLYLTRFEKILKGLAPVLERSPTAMSEALLALDYYEDSPKQIVIVTSGHNPTHASIHPSAVPFLEVLSEHFIPNRFVAVFSQRDRRRWDTNIALVRGKVARDQKTTVYLCENRVCQFPVTEPEEFRQQFVGKP